MTLEFYDDPHAMERVKTSCQSLGSSDNVCRQEIDLPSAEKADMLSGWRIPWTGLLDSLRFWCSREGTAHSKGAFAVWGARVWTQWASAVT